MKVQKFTSTAPQNKVFTSHSNNGIKTLSNKQFYDMDSVDGALLTDSVDDPILPQVVRKFRKAYNILFPAKVVKEAANIKKQIDSCVDGNKFQAVA